MFDALSQFLSQNTKRKIWVLSETKLRTSELESALASTHLKVSFLTRAEAFTRFYWQLVRLSENKTSASSNRRIEFLSETESFSLLRKVVLSQSDRFPQLKTFLEVPQSEFGIVNSRNIFSDTWRSALRFLQTLRNRSEGGFISSRLTDEFGNTSEGRELEAELILLLSEHRSLQAELGVRDPTGSLEFLFKFLSDSPETFQNFLKTWKSSPEMIVIEHPTYMSELEQDLVLEVAKLLPTQVILSETLSRVGQFKRDSYTPFSPGIVFVEPLVKFFENNATVFTSVNVQKSVHSENFLAGMSLWNPLIKNSLDTNNSKNIFSHVQLWECAGRRAEVRRCLKFIQSEMEQGALPSDFHIFATELEPYFELLQAEAEQISLPLVLPRGTRLDQTSAGTCLQAFLEFWETPTFVSAEELLSHPFMSSRVPKSFFRELKRRGISLHSAIDSTWFSEAAYLCSLDFQHEETEFIAYDAAQLRGELEIFQQEVKRLFVTEDLKSEGVRSLRHKIFSTRKRLADIRRLASSDALETPAFRKSLQNAARGWRSVRRIFRAAEVFEINQKRANNHQQKALEHSEIFAVLRSALITTYLSQELHGEQIIATDFLDSRSTTGRRCIVLGLTRRAFPLVRNDELPLTVFDEVRTRILTSRGQLASTECFWLLLLQICESKELILSFPSYSEAGEELPSAVLTEIYNQKSSSTLAEVKDVNSSTPTVMLVKLAEASAQLVQSRVETLQQRYSSSFTEYDGTLNLSQFPELKTGLPGGSSKPARYSLSELELLKNCPHKYFFRKLLHLESFPEEISEDASLLLGDIAHSCLEKFFSEKENSESTRKDFPRACMRMERIADEVLGSYSIPWHRHPDLQRLTVRLKDGLAEPSGKTGILKAALLAHRDVLKGEVETVEYVFGDKENTTPPLQIESSSGKIHVRGKIDRIDSVQSEDGTSSRQIWDYKTGSAPTFAAIEQGKSLQVPIYAAAIQQNFTPQAFPQRGGCLELSSSSLSSGNKTLEEDDVIVEHLAVRREKNRLQSDVTAVGENVSRALETVRELHTLVTQGNLHQVLDTDHCESCEFRGICYRNEMQLEKKLLHDASNVAAETFQKSALLKTSNSESLLAKPKFSLKPLSAEQIPACDVSTSAALLAGAGSGKTHVLATRVLRLILAGESLSSIVAITFTEKAAEELKQRIEQSFRAVLSERQYDGNAITEIQADNVIRALANLSSAWIGTIHGYCRALLSMDSALSGISSFERMLDSAAQQSWAQDVVQRVLSASGTPTRTLTDHLLESGFRWKELASLVVKFVLDPEVLGRLSSSVGLNVQNEAFQVSLEELAQRIWFTELFNRTQTLKEFCREWVRSVTVWCQTEAPDLIEPEAIAKFLELATELKDVQQSFGLMESGPDPLQAAVQVVTKLSALQKFVLESKWIAKSKSKKNPRNYWKEVKDKLSETEVEPFSEGTQRELRVLETSRQICLLASECLEQFTREKSAKGAVDFTDLLQRVKRMFDTRLDGEAKNRQRLLLERIRRQHRHFLVDEFQDTDLTQWGIIRTIQDALFTWTSNNGAQSPSTLFLVGDSQQSIYGFRGGDLKVFHQALSEIRKAGQPVLSLSDNYRSSPGVVTFVNEFFRRTFADEREGSVAYFQEMQARARSHNIESVFILSATSERKSEGKKLQGDALLRTEAAEIAQFLQKVRIASQDTTHAEQLGKQKRWSNLDFRAGAQVALLCRTTQQIKLLAHALESENLPFRISHSKGFYEQEEIQQLLSTLRLLAEPEDSISLVGVLRSSLVGLTDTDLFELGQILSFEWVLLWSWEGNKKLTSGKSISAIVEFLQQLFSIARVSTPSQVLEWMLQTTNAEQVYSVASRQSAFENILRFLEQLRGAERNGEVATTPLAVCRWVESLSNNTVKAPTASSYSDPIILTTIHAAKGLEFPMVILPFLSSTRTFPRNMRIAELPVFEQGRDRQFDLEKKQLVTLASITVEDFEFRRTKSAVSAAVQAEASRIEREEAKRLFYVGCTRAKEYLILSCRTTNLPSFNEAKSERSLKPADWLRSICKDEKDDFWTMELHDGNNLAIPIIHPQHPSSQSVKEIVSDSRSESIVVNR